MKASLWTGLIGAGFLLPCGQLQATDVGGPIVVDTTWSVAGNPYVLTSNILVGNDATLTIEPGVEVRVNPSLVLVVGSLALGAGTIVASGTEEDPILFTANGTPVPGEWIGIHFTDHAVDATFDKSGYVSGCKLEHAVIEYAGGGESAIRIDKCSAYLVNCEIRHTADRGVFVDGTSGPAVRIESCEIWDCNSGFAVNDGGGIFIDGGSKHILAANFVHDCQAPGNGGGIMIQNVDNCVFSGNVVSNNSSGGPGGGIYAVLCNGMNFQDNMISGNIASASAGGIYLAGGGNITVRDNIVINNSGDNGGGIYLSGGGNTMLLGNTISGNSTTQGPGAGIYAINSHEIIVSNNCIKDNSSASGGGGIFAKMCNLWTVESNAVLNNSAQVDGGAMWLDLCDNWVFSGNEINCNESVAGEVGGILVERSMNLSLAGDFGLGIFNRITGNTGCQIRNTNLFENKPGANVDATFVNWGTTDPDVIQEGICDFFDNAAWAVVVWAPPGPGSNSPDVDCDCVVGTPDLLTLLAAWGPCPNPCPPSCPADLDDDCIVGVPDLLTLLANWG